MNFKLIEETVHSQAVLQGVRSAEARCTKPEYLDTLFELQMHVLTCRGNAARHLFFKEVEQHEGA